MNSGVGRKRVQWLAMLLVVMLTTIFIGVPALSAEDQTMPETQQTESQESATPKAEPEQVQVPAASQPSAAPSNEGTAQEPSQPTQTQTDGSATGETAQETDPAPTDAAGEQPPAEQPDATAAPSEEPGATREPEQYEIRFLNADGSLFQAATRNEGQSIKIPKTDPSLEGHDFKHWYRAGESQTSPFFFGGSASEDLTFKPYFTPIEQPATEDGEQLPEEPATEDGEPQPEEPATEGGEQQAEEPATEGGEPQPEEPATEDGEQLPEEPVTEEPAIEEGEVPLEPAKELNADLCSVHIASSAGDVVDDGDTITLTGTLTGFDGWDTNLQWQYNAGSGWADAGGANDRTHSFTADAQTMQYRWRLLVSVVK